MKRVRQNGFTLVELMIVVAIIAILATIAMPAYQEYVKRGHRAAAQSEMMAIANLQQQFFLANRSYAATVGALGYTLPAAVAAKYDPTITADNTATPPTFNIAFAAKGTQTSDGNLGLNSEGVKTPAGKW
ncbi:MAG: prepilin-type cleavage/methylation domain-containing protein [Hydrogenophilales bacterium 17-61-9]|nr:MAG: prepilin-type cleavage/methylation domain-containing protein [Hydrogenophilales bacterium 17-61-9]